MYGEHWSDEELVARLYGIRPEDSHLRECESCTRRWEAIRLKYDSMRPGTVDVPEVFLAAQRRAITARLGARHFPIRRALVPVMAALVLGAVLVVMRPAPEKPAPLPEISDSQLFDDVFRRASATEPSSVEPIRSLFEEQK